MLLRKLTIRILLTSVVVSAALGIIAVLSGGLSDLAWRVCETTMTVSFTSLLALAAIAAWDKSSATVFSRLGLGASLAMAAILISAIWLDHLLVSPELLLSLLIVSVGGAHGSLVALARLAPQQQWIRACAHLAGSLLAMSFLALLWEVIDDSPHIWRAVAVIAILDAAISLAIIVLHVMTPAVAHGD